MRQIIILLFCVVTPLVAFSQFYDCATSDVQICGDESFNETGTFQGFNDFGNTNNDDGCLGGEQWPMWMTVTFDGSTPPGSTFEFSVTPSGEDFDFAIYGPNVDCSNLGSPIRCTFAYTFSSTGLGNGQTDTQEFTGGDGFLAPLVVNPNETYIIIISNFFNDNLNFDLTVGGSAAPFLNCCSLQADAGNDITICEGDPSFSLNGGSSDNTGPVSYQWTATNGGTAYLSSTTSPTPTVTIPDGVSGTFEYTLTATDSECSATDVVVVTVNPAPVGNLTASAMGVCPGDNVTLTVDPGFSAYQWNTGSNSNQITVSTGGTYTVLITDANMCTSQETIVIDSYTSPVVNISGGLSLCAGNSTTLDAGGPYASYSWNTGDMTQTISVATPGTYTVTVINADGCMGVGSVDVTSQPNLSPVIGGNSTFCSGGSTTLSAGGPYDTYTWSTTETTQQITVSTPGTYTVTVTESGCTGEASIVVTESNGPSPTISGNLSFCTGETTILTADPGFTYLWSTTETTQSIVVSTPGTYSLTVTDASSCTGETSVIVVENPTPQPVISGTPSICPGGSTILDAGPGFSSYSWSTGDMTQTATVSNTGLVTVTVTDGNGCTGTANVNVAQNPPPTVNISGPNNICNGENATLTADAGFVSYDWSTTDVGGSININTPGTYSVTATDASGCEAIASFTVSQSPDLTPMITGNNSFCSGESVTLDAGPGYSSYMWSDGSGTQAIDVSTPGSVSVTVQDAAGCTGTAIVTVTENPTPVINITGDTEFCVGESVFLDAGAGFVSYQWSNGGLNQSTLILAGGVYTVTVTDANGCTAEESILVSQFQNPNPTITGQLSFCSGEGTVLDAGGGFASYEWSNGSMDQILAVTTGGVYTVTVTNADGCEGTATVNVIENPNPNPVIQGNSTICQGESTTLSVGTFQNYQWSTTDVGPSISVSTPGLYEVTVTNSSGCQGVAQIQVIQQPPVVPIINGDMEICSGETGILEASPGFQTYTWSTGDPGETLLVTNPGEYTVTVTDANGCQGEATTFVTVSDAPVAEITGNLEICPGTPTILTAASGPYIYQWSTNEATQSITVDQPGTYSVLVTNSANCVAEAEVIVTAQSDPTPIISGLTEFCEGGSTILTVQTGFASYNWSDGTQTPAIQIDEPGDYDITVTTSDGCEGISTVTITENAAPILDIQGQTNLCQGNTTELDAGAGFASYTWSDMSNGQTLEVAATGTYSVTVTDANGCEAVDQVIVNINANPNPQITGSLSFCPGGATTLSGGNFDTYAWSTNESTPTISVNTPGIYEVTVTDANGCEGIASVNVEELSELSPVISGDLNFCEGGNTILDAGNGFDTYTWSDMSTDQQLDVTTPGTYSVTVTSGGCSGETSVTVVENVPPSITIAGDAMICEGGATTLNPGAGFSNYLWSDGTNNSTLQASTAGTYSVTVTDANGCTDTADFTLSVNANPEPVIGGSLSFCTDGNTQLDAGAGFASYMWSDGTQTQTITIDTPGDVSVVVTDANGCQGTATVSIEELPELSPVIAGDLSFCEGDSTTLNAGAGFDTYTWSDMSTDQQLNVTTPGTYSLTVSDAGGCEGTATVEVIENPIPVVNITGEEEICQGNSTTLSAGTFDDYSWSTLSASPSIDVSTANTYILTVTDANGCQAVDSIAVSVNPLPSPVVQGALEFCEGDSTLLSTDQEYDAYVWSGMMTSDTFSVSVAGQVDLMVTDSNGCVGSTFVNVTEIAAPQPMVTGDLDFCLGESTMLDAGNGFSSYVWSTGSNNQTVNIDSAGTYTVAVTDINGCTGTTSVDISENALPTVNISGETDFCTGETITLDAGMGFASYTWSDASNNQTLDVSAAGTYTVEVTDANACSNTAQLVVSENTPPNPQIAGSLTFCPGLSTTLDGGAGFASYAWSDGTMGQSIDVNTAGNYSLTVTDANGCEGETNVDVTEDGVLMPSIGGSLQYCAGDSTTLDAGAGFDTYTWSDMSVGQQLSVTAPGTYSVTVTNGGCSGETSVTVSENTLPAPVINGEDEICAEAVTTLSLNDMFNSYTWSDGTNNASLEVGPGQYSVIVTDANQCSAEATFEVNTLPAPVPVLTGITAICNGSNTTIGTADPYATYSWSTGSDQPQTVVSTPGMVSVTVTDANGCEGNNDILIEELDELQPIISGDLTYCPGDSTILDAGVGYATYQWSDMSANQQLNVSTPGTYGLTVTDASGCSGTTTVEVLENAPPMVDITGENEICAGSITTLDAGTGFANYEWSDNTNNQTLEVGAAGTYTVEVTDANGCTNTAQFVVTENALPNPQIAGSLTFCPGLSTTLDGGAGFASYAWSDGTMGQSIDVNTAGNYSLTVTDANGCEGETNVDVTEDGVLMPSIGGSLQYCAGDSTTLDAGAGFDTYTWSDMSVGQQLSVTAPGTYSVTVTDGGCSGETTVTVLENALPTPTINGDDEICVDALTTLSLNDNYASYEWSDGTNNASLEVGPGQYSVVVTDANQCTAEATFEVNTLPAPVPVFTGNASICNGGATTLGIADSYTTYSWSTGSDQPQTQVTTPGVVMVTVTDANGCEGTNDILIEELDELQPIITGELAYCAGDSTVLDAGMGYTNYQWSDMSADQTINVNAPGTYSLTVSDASGCQGTATVDVIENTLPQPIIGGETQFCEGTQTSLSVDSGFATYDWSNGDQDFETDITQPGMVTVIVTDANGCENTAAINIIELANPEPQITGNTGFCAGESTTLTTSENYDSYLWSDMSTDASFVANQAGFYDVTVEDMNGCQGTTSIEVVEFATPMPQIQGILEICEGENTTLSLDAAYTSYAWSTNEATASVAIDMAGVVEVVVTDANGCSGTTSEEIIVNPIPEVMISGLDYFCTNTSTDIMVEGSFNAYNWSNNEMTPGITVDMPGEYTVEVEDAAGCLGTASIMVEEIALPQADPGMLQTIDCAQETVTIGGMGTSQGNYSYTWTGPGIDANNENEYQPIVDQEGTYTLVVEDLDFGCISTMEEVLVEDVRYEPVIELAVAEILDCDTESTEINSNGSTSGASIVYEWYNESGDLVSNDLNYLADEPGTYTLVIFDELTSCTNSSMIEVEQDISEPVVDAGDEQGIDCDTPEATLDGSDSQSGANIVYEWFSESGTGIVGDNTQPVITVNEAGSYTLIVTNQSNGCTSEQSVAVNGDFEPPIANAGADQTLDCFSTLVTLDGSASTIGSNISYTWTDDNGTEISTNASLEVDNEGTYQLTVLNNENGCTAQDEVIVLQNEEDLNAFGTIVDGPTCFGDDDASILIVDIEGGEEPFLYNLNGGAYTVSPDFDDLTAGTYEVGVQDAKGCEVLTEIVIEDGNDLNVNLGEDMTIQLGEEINVQAEVSIPRGEIELIDWMTSDSSGCEDCLLFEVSPFVTSQYTVTVIDSNGCVASDVLTIFVDARDEIFMPTVFSPNGDDQNDYFTIYGGADVLNIRTLNIFDRWGNLMFAGEGLAPNNELEGWDGNFKGQPQNTGVYIFMAEVEFLDGTVKLFKGDVLLMR